MIKSPKIIFIKKLYYILSILVILSLFSNCSESNSPINNDEPNTTIIVTEDSETNTQTPLISPPHITSSPNPTMKPNVTCDPVPQTEFAEQIVDSNGYYSFTYNTIVRKYILYIPENLPQNSPLVFMLHGYGNNAKSFQSQTNMDSIAETNKFVVVYPQGLKSNSNSYPKTHWNAGFTFTDIDDTGFLVSLAAYLQVRYNLNPQETFAAGHSNGGFMCYKLAISAPNTFKAVASVAGTMSGETWELKDSSDTAVSILEIHCIDDNRIPIDGSLSENGGWGGAPELSKVIEYWRNRYDLDKCLNLESDKIRGYNYYSSESNRLVWYYKLEGIGHRWPTKNNIGINAEDLIWEFFNNYIE